MSIKTLKLIFGLWVVFQFTGNPQAVLTLEYSGVSADSIDILIRGENLSAIGAITLKINYDTQKIGWGRLITEASGLSGSLAGINTSTLTIAWDNLSGYTASNEIMYRLRFKYFGGPFGLNFNSAICELADINGNIVNVVYNNLSVSAVREDRENVSLPIVEIYPNPANDYVNLAFTLSKRGTAEISLCDNTGRTVKYLPGIDCSAGHNQVRINDLSKDLSSGIYFVRIQLLNSTINKKLLLIK